MFEADEALVAKRQINDHPLKLAAAQPIGSSGYIDADLDGDRKLLHRIGHLTAYNFVSGDEQYRAEQIRRGGVHQWVPARLDARTDRRNVTNVRVFRIICLSRGEATSTWIPHSSGLSH